MNYLFIHDALPGQFKHLLKELLGEGHTIVGASRLSTSSKLPFRQVMYDLPTGVDAAKADPGKKAVTLGLACYKALRPLWASGFRPDVIVSHAGRGAGYFIRDLFPNARFVTYLEWYVPTNSKEGLEQVEIARHNKAHLLNMALTQEFALADAALSPTYTQRAQFPALWQPGINVLHDGIDTELYQPDPDARFEFAGRTFTRKDKVVTYAARGMEHTRGFPAFMKAIALAQKADPALEVLIAAADRICYDPGAKGVGLKAWAEAKVDYDPARTHFLGVVKEVEFVKLLQVSWLHVYLSQPFVLSWSLLNAMSVGLPVLASDNAPVREVITDGETGYLVPEGDVEAVAQRITEIVGSPTAHTSVQEAARALVLDRYELRKCVSAIRTLVDGTGAK
ncbi:glycosyltransferase [Kordiimonas sp.]|uniref:glycosyltransferase n=2 Tax=Kordiimonas sp. TaxID=1970157 RepID=UPI003A8CD6ED